MSKTVNQIDRAWEQLSEGYINKVLSKSENTIQTLWRRLDEKEQRDTRIVRRLLSAYYIAARAIALKMRNYECLVAAAYLQEMQDLACSLGDVDHQVIALVGKGELYARRNELEEAQACLKKAAELSPADPVVQGYRAQLQGRLYSYLKDEERFRQAMQEAEQLAGGIIDLLGNRLHGQYHLGTVYLEYARHYCRVGRIEEGLGACAKAEASLSVIPLWRPYLLKMHGELLVKRDHIEKGIPLILEAIALAKKQDNHHLLDTFYALQRYLSERAIKYANANSTISEAISGPFDF